MKKMQKREYNRPSMRVVELRGRQRILAGSDEPQRKKATMDVTYEEEDI